MRPTPVGAARLEEPLAGGLGIMGCCGLTAGVWQAESKHSEEEEEVEEDAMEAGEVKGDTMRGPRPADVRPPSLLLLLLALATRR